MRLLRLVLLGAAIAACGGDGSGGGQCRSVVETVDAESTVAGELSLSTDAEGGVHVAYADSATMSLRYAYLPPRGEWVLERVSTFDDVGHTAVAADPEGTVHVCYQDRSSRSLRYVARSPSGAWGTSETVDTGDVGVLPVVVATGDGAVHVVHAGTVSGSVHGLHYAHRSPDGVWDVVEEVDPDALSGAALDVDGSGIPHVVYSATSTLQIRHSRRDGPSWAIDTIDARGGAEPQISVDEAGNAHVVYLSQDVTMLLRLIYAVRPASGGEADLDESGPVLGFDLSFDRDRSGTLHLASRQGLTAGGLRYVSRSPSGAWSAPETVDDAGNFSSISLAADPFGRVHIAYLDGLPRLDLKRAVLCPVP